MKIISYSFTLDRGWLRIFKYGVKYKNISIGLTFSERNGYTKYIKIGKYVFNLITKN